MPENFDDIKGRAKEATGDLSDNDRLKREGKVDRTKGGLKGALGDVSNKVKGILNKNK